MKGSTNPALAASRFQRYARQVRYEWIGQEGQRRLARGRVTLVGCGALGSVIADTLVRAGAGLVRIVDRDYLELDNLQRQTLFDEEDLKANLPKAAAAAARLGRINSDVCVEPEVADFNAANAERLCADADVILDGTDNFETRYLINDVAVKLDRPWVYGACLGADGVVLPIVPRETPCLRCLWDTPPAPGLLETCETAGVLAPAVHLVAAFQSLVALKILAGLGAELTRGLISIQGWTARVRRVDVQAALVPGACPCCQQGRFDYLEGDLAAAATVLCGRDAVQVRPAAGQEVDFAALAQRLAEHQPQFNEYLLRLSVPPYALTLFRDGRAIITGTSDPAAARSIYARYVGL